MECTNLAACKFTVGRITFDDTWELLVTNIQQQQLSSTTTRTGSCIYNTTPVVRLLPENSNKKRSNNRFPIWQTHHFHTELYIPLPQQRDDSPQTVEDDGRILVFLFEGMAREDIAISISPTIPASKTTRSEGMYQILLGAAGNTRTIVTKPKFTSQQSKPDTTAPTTTTISTPGRVCTEKGWVSYWVCFQPSQEIIAVGVGNVPGQRCITITSSSCTTTNPTTDDAVRIKDDDEAEIPSGEINDEKIALPRQPASGYYVGMANVAQYDRQAPAPIKIRNIRYTSIIQQQQQQHPLFTILQKLQIEKLNLIDVTIDSTIITTADSTITAGADAAAGINPLSDSQLLLEYKKECEKARIRAQKFGIEYKEPPVAAFVPWSEARRLQANPTTGFITGINMLDPSEQDKIQQRKQRFQHTSTGGDSGDDAGTELTDHEKLELRKQRFQLTTENNNDVQSNTIVPIEQAWDNEIHVRKFRTDPPPNLWKDNNPASATTTNNNEEEGMDIDPFVWVPEKIHLFTIDWSAFKQIRSEDIMMYFDTYGPSYVEWLGDLSCNVHFQDQYTAQRVLYNLATPLPSPPPPELVAATVSDERPDLGNMGWYMGKTMVTKRQNDRFGKKGTQARVLLRFATSLDILQNRPSSWPQPPPGYTIHEVLGPGSDQYNSQSHRNKRSRQNDKSQQTSTNNSSIQRQNTQKNKGNVHNNAQQHSDDGNTSNSGKKKRNRRNNKREQSSNQQQEQQQSKTNQNSAKVGDEPSGMYTGLSARRDGFSVEELEAERAKKRLKS